MLLMSIIPYIVYSQSIQINSYFKHSIVFSFIILKTIQTIHCATRSCGEVLFTVYHDGLLSENLKEKEKILMLIILFVSCYVHSF